MDEVRLRAPAKINLFLEIKGGRGDGYHDIVTLFYEIGLCDEIVMRRAEGETVLRISSPGGITVPEGPDNLCLRALDALRAEAGIETRFEVELKKRIPPGAGLGGGSTDAAAVIKGANQLCGRGLNEYEMERIAGKVGSDAPFFVRGGAAIGRGRGAELERVNTFKGEYWAVLAKPDFPVSTEWAYGQAGNYRGVRELDAEEVSAGFSAGDRDYLEGLLFNAFEDIVFPRHPELKSLKERLIGAGCRGALLCGSGSAVFGLCHSKGEAEKALERLADLEGLEMIEVCRLA
ncbi:MAG: 4-(cytidine 5'-diphospho)-2-C-methyl-D-erythritol kinase [bacterium]